MGIIVDWDTPEKTAVRLDFPEQCSWADFDQAIDELRALIGSVTHRVDVISTLPSRPRVRIRVYSGIRLKDVLAHLGHTVSYIHTNTGSIVIVGASPIAQSFLSTFFKTSIGFSQRVYFASSLDEAHTFSRPQRYSLSPRPSRNSSNCMSGDI